MEEKSELSLQGRRGAEAEQVRLGEVFDLQMGKTPDRDNIAYWGGTHAWVAIADIKDSEEYISTTKEAISDEAVRETKIKSVPPDTLIMSFKLTIGRVAITRDQIYTNEAIMAFIDKGLRELDLHYLYHQFKNKDWTPGSNRAVMGTTLNKASLSSAKIFLPSLPDQKQIAATLDKICELKKNAEAQIELLKLLVKSRFVEMFGMGKEWENVGLLDLGECKNGINFTPNESGYELRCVGVSDFKDLTEISKVESIALIELDSRPAEALLLRDGDILFVRSNGNKNLVGRCVIIHPGTAEVTFSGFCIRYRITSPKLSPIYAVQYLRQPHVKRLLQGRGANIQNMSQRTLADVTIPLPPLALQREFAAFVEKVEKTEATLRELAGNLDVLYRSKLQEYFG